MAVRDVEPAVADVVAAMPKAELHLHLDGALRLSTIADLACEQGIALPGRPDDLHRHCVVSPECRDLVGFLRYFAVPLQVLQTPEALERAVYELAEDVRRENVRYVEIRFGPSLHREGGMSLQEVIAAAARGWRAAQARLGLSGGLILCALRHLSPQETMAVARAGLPFLGRGVVGFDLAGDEAGYPVLLHREPLIWARDAGYGLTLHAGEAAGAQSVRDAVEVLGAARIGHGVRSGEDPAVLRLLRARGTVLEMCPTSNAQTRAVTSLNAHPLARFYRQGVRVTVNTDNRTVSDTNMTHELSIGHDELGLSVAELANITLTAVEAGFGDLAERRALLRDYRAEMLDLGMLDPGN